VSFSGATIHDMFNVLTVSVLLPIELIARYLERCTKLLVFDAILPALTGTISEPEILTKITKPLTNLIMQLDKATLEAIANKNVSENATLIKHVCSKQVQVPVTVNGTNTTKTIKQNVPCRFLLLFYYYIIFFLIIIRYIILY
jgi:solute carrier family 34 (sodium-dependent phosphate cotransporter)